MAEVPSRKGSLNNKSSPFFGLLLSGQTDVWGSMLFAQKNVADPMIGGFA